MTQEHKDKIANALRGKKKSQEHIDALIANHKGRTGIPAKEETKRLMSEKLKGRVMSPEWIEKLRLAKLGKPSLNKGRKYPSRSGENHWRWKGGSSELMKLRTSPEYKEWRSQVFKRDRWTCVHCGYRSKGKINGKSDIEADHILSFTNHPDARFDIDNGQTLCVSCHTKKTSESGLRGNAGKPKKKRIT